MRTITIIAASLAVAGCMNGPGPQRYHVLDVPSGGTRAVLVGLSSRTLLVAPTTAASFYDVEAIVYSRSPGLRSYYQVNSWAERPSRQIGTLLKDRLSASGGFASVAATDEGVRGTLLLATHLVELYHDASTTPGTVRIVLAATLTDPVSRIVIDRRRFVASSPVPADDAAGAVLAISRALEPLLDEVVAWTVRVPAQPGTELATPLAAPGRVTSALDRSISTSAVQRPHELAGSDAGPRLSSVPVRN